MIMPFGKFRGRDIKQLPEWYLRWLMRTVQEKQSAWKASQLFSTEELLILALLVVQDINGTPEDSPTGPLWTLWEKIDAELKRRGEAGGDPENVCKSFQRLVEEDERKIAENERQIALLGALNSAEPDPGV